MVRVTLYNNLIRNVITSPLKVFFKVSKIQFCINSRVSFRSITLYNCDQKKISFYSECFRNEIYYFYMFDFKQYCMKISFVSHILLMIFSLIRNKIFCGI